MDEVTHWVKKACLKRRISLGLQSFSISTSLLFHSPNTPRDVGVAMLFRAALCCVKSAANHRINHSRISRYMYSSDSAIFSRSITSGSGIDWVWLHLGVSRRRSQTFGAKVAAKMETLRRELKDLGVKVNNDTILERCKEYDSFLNKRVYFVYTVYIVLRKFRPQCGTSERRMIRLKKT